jgi:hypothetical protein
MDQDDRKAVERNDHVGRERRMEHRKEIPQDRTDSKKNSNYGNIF